MIIIYRIFWMKESVNNNTQIWSRLSKTFFRAAAEIPSKMICTYVKQWPQHLRHCIEREERHLNNLYTFKKFIICTKYYFRIFVRCFVFVL